MKYILILVLLISFSIKANNKIENEALLNETISNEKCSSLISEKLNLLNGKITVDLPEGFGLMSEEMLAVKYPSNNRPTLVYTNDDGTINFAFNHTANAIPKGKLPELLPAFVQQFNAIYPEMQWFKKEVEVLNGRNFIKLEFISPAPDSRIYNIMYVTVLEGKMLMCSFNCLESQKSEWELKAKETLNSIEIND